MSYIVLASRKASVIIYSAWALISFSPISSFMNAWYQAWAANRVKILVLTNLNTTMTLANEYITRSVLSKGVHRQRHFKFIIGDGPWYKNINRQSLINVWMTFFASLLGAPVYFFKRRIYRFLFFVSFGTFNSFFAQGALSILREKIIAISMSRLFFDFCYNGSLKFFMFEFFRRPILSKCSIFKLTYIRGKQDLLTTFFKNSFLNIFGFKG